MIDIGVNLAHRSFDRDREDIIRRAREAGVETMIITGTSLAGSAQALELARTHALYATAGIHPHDAKSMNAESERAIEALAEDRAVVAIGECGLDYNRDFSPRPIQNECFEMQLALAKRLDRPVFLHERDAHDTFVALFKNHRARGVVHCFTGDTSVLKAYLDLGLHIGVTGWICDERRNHDLLEAVRYIPLDRLMIETDAPYLAPRTLRPQPERGRNEPAFLTHVRNSVALATGKTPEEIGRATTDTARRFFRLPGSAVSVR